MFLFGNVIECVLYHKFTQKESLVVWYSWDIVVVIIIVVAAVITAVNNVCIVDFAFSCIFVLNKFDFEINSLGKITI